MKYIGAAVYCAAALGIDGLAGRCGELTWRRLAGDGGQ